MCTSSLVVVHAVNNGLLNAGNGDGAWEAAEPPPADSAPAQPGPGGESSLMPITEAAPPPAAPVAATNPDLEIPAAELVAMLKAELDSDTFNCPLTLVCN